MKLAIFYRETIPTLFMLEKAAKDAGFEIHLFHLKDIHLCAETSGLELYVNNISLKDFSAVFVRGFWDFQDEVAVIARFCKQNKIALFDSALYSQHIISKIDDLLAFQSVGLPIIKTLFLSATCDVKMIEKELSFPIVTKENRSRKGQDVFLLRNSEELKDFIDKIKSDDKTLDTKMYQFQKFIPADYDLRVIVLGGEVLGTIKRQSVDPHEFRHNVSLGGTATKVEISQEMKEMAIKAAKSMNYELAGVDLITDKNTGETFVLEINRSPGFEGFMAATGIDLPAELMKFFLATLAK
jgi:ribosomal protein S6--L-glutamate ligase